MITPKVIECLTFASELCEALYFLRPTQLTLTKEELTAAALEGGFGHGNIKDMWQAVEQRQANDLEIVESALACSREPRSANFIRTYQKDRRNFRALDAMVTHLKKRADDEGQEHAFATRQELIEISGVPLTEARTSFELLRAGSWLAEDKENKAWRLASSRWSQMLPGAQVKQGQPIQAHPAFDKAYDIMTKVLAGAVVLAPKPKAAPRMPSQPEVSMANKQTPVKKYTVFVSSTLTDLEKQRSAVSLEILKMKHIPCGMEQFSAASERGWETITDTIDICDYYVLIVGGRYGSIDPGTGISWTEREMDYAVSKGIPTLAFIRDMHAVAGDHVDTEPEKVEKLKRLKERIQKDLMYKVWKDEGDLCNAVMHALVDQIASDAKHGRPRLGWYRGDNYPTALSEVSAPPPFRF